MQKNLWKKMITVATFALLMIGFSTQIAWAGSAEYRLYNPNSGEHFYTANTNERNSLVKAGWRYEGYAWVAAEKNSSPVYRLYNPNSGDHHYTSSEGEKNALVKAGWREEGIGWYSEQTNGRPVYRLYNPNAKTGAHHYTLSGGEKNALQKAGWHYEGIGWYAVNEDTPADDTLEVNRKYAPKRDYSNTSLAMKDLKNASERTSANNIINAIVNNTFNSDHAYVDGAWYSPDRAQAISDAVMAVIDPLNLWDKGTDLDGSGWSYYEDNGKDQIVWCRVDKAHNLYLSNQKAMKQVHAFIDPYIHAGMRDDQKVRSIHDRIKFYLTYDYTYQIDDWQAALRAHRGMCGAYAELFHVCCDVCGLQDKIALGDTYQGGIDEGLHAWNYVKMNGSWYYIDVTWDDSLSSDQYYLSPNGWIDHKLSYYRYK